MQNSESGRKINQAVNNTSRAVGGAISQAKGAFSYWWSSITTTPANTNSANSDNTNNTNESNTNRSSQEISVTFQNNSNEDKIEVGIINVHTEEGIVYKKIEQNDSQHGSPLNKPSTTAGGGGAQTVDNQDEKLIDSAEELMEENQLDKIDKQPVDFTKTEPQPRRGIVEIGKEAEVLDKEDNKQTESLNNCGTIDLTETNNTTTTCTNGNIFIV